MLGKQLQTAAAGNAGGDVLGVEDVFSTYLYTGNGTTQTITNGIDLTGEGGMVWIKNRDASGSDHLVSDTERGNNATIRTNKTDSQIVFLNSFGIQHGSSGFTVQGENNSADGRNNSGNNYASWTFRKAKKFFDVVTYTGNSSNRTIAHNLGSVPGCIMVKRTDTSGDWQVYHRANTANPETDYLVLNSTAATADSNTRWNDTAPTSTEFTVGTEATVNASGGTYVAYVFAHDAGGFGDSGTESVIKCGTFTADGSGLFDVNLGWEPQWILYKNPNSSSDSWYVTDSMRLFARTGFSYVTANTAAAEVTANAEGFLFPTATGFQSTNNSLGTNSTWIYIAIRRGPMKTPTDATTVFAAQTDNQTGNGYYAELGAPVDAWWYVYGKNTTHLTIARTRLTGANFLKTDSTSAETTQTTNFFDKSLGVRAAGAVSTDTNNLSWVWRRAPGFSDVVTYTGNNVSGREIKHNLGVAPEMMLVKRRGFPGFWAVYHTSQPTKFGKLDLTDGFTSSFALEVFGNGNATVAPTASVFTVGGLSQVNTSDNYIAYLFASCPGVSKVGSYTGTGTTLNVDCGFTAGARFVLIKRTDDTGDWYVWDTARGIVSGNDPYLLLNSTSAEVSSTDYIDPLSSGFQISSTAPAAINANGGSYIFLAIA